MKASRFTKLLASVGSDFEKDTIRHFLALISGFDVLNFEEGKW